MFVPGRPFQPSIVMVGKERSLPSCAASETCFTWLSTSLSQNIRLVLKGLTGTNTTAFVNNRQEKFYHIGFRAKCYTTFYDHNLQCSFRVLVRFKLFQCGLIFDSKVRAYPSEVQVLYYSIGP